MTEPHDTPRDSEENDEILSFPWEDDPQDAVLPVTMGRVEDAIIRNELSYFINQSGQLGLPWTTMTAFLGFPNDSMLEMRCYWMRHVHMDYMSMIRHFVEQWNRERIGPAAFLSVNDDGEIVVIGRFSMMIARGATNNQLAGFIQSSCRMAAVWMDTLNETFPDPLLQRPPHE